MIKVTWRWQDPFTHKTQNLEVKRDERLCWGDTGTTTCLDQLGLTLALLWLEVRLGISYLIFVLLGEKNKTGPVAGILVQQKGYCCVTITLVMPLCLSFSYRTSSSIPKKPAWIHQN